MGINYYFFTYCRRLFVVTEKLWSGLENFVFDWLINADRYFCCWW